MHGQLLAVRAAELKAARLHFPPAGEVLEVGAGNGWQAHQLVQDGYRVTALDVDPSNPDLGQHHPVALYDGVHLPLADASVDVVFSSNVLEHVRDLPGLLVEMRRVLRPGGRSVHVLPTPVWRAWTIATRYPYLVQLAGSRRRLPATSALASKGGARLPRSGGAALALLRRALVEPPHGEFRSSLAELDDYRAQRWEQRFGQAGWRVERSHGAGVFYTGYGVLPMLGIARRQALSHALGSSCRVFVLSPSDGT